MADYDLNPVLSGGGLLGGGGGGSSWLGNLFNFSGGRSTTADLYGDLFTKKQLAAIQQRESQAKFGGLLNVLSQAAAPSKFKKDWGQILGQAGGAMLGSTAIGDAAAESALKGGLTAQQIAKLRREAELQGQISPIVLEYAKRLLQGGGGGGMPGAAPGAPTVPSPGVPAQPPPGPTPDAPPPGPVGQPPPFGRPSLPYGGPGGAQQPLPFGSGGGAPVLPTGGPPMQSTSLAPPGPPNPMLAGLLGGPTQPPFSPEEDSLPPPDTVIPSGPGGAGLLNPDAVTPAAFGFGGGSALGPYARGNATIGGKSSVEGVQAEFAGRLKSMIDAMPPELQARFKIESGFRDAARQQQVNPGVTNSRHTHGIAIDTNRDPAVQAWITANGPKFGVGYTLAGMPGEDNHLEMLGEGGGRVGGLPIIRAQYSPGGGAPGGGAPGGGAPAAAGGVSDKIPGVGASPQELAALDMLAEMAGMKTPFKSLLDAYYKTPGYQEQSAGAAARGRIAEEEPMQRRMKYLDLMIGMRKDGIIFDPKTNTVSTDPSYDALIGRREEDKQAIVLNYQKKLKTFEESIKIEEEKRGETREIGKEGRQQTSTSVVGPEGRLVDRPMPQAERDRRLREQSMRPGEYREGDVVTKPTANLGPNLEWRITPQGTFEAASIANTPAEREAKAAAEKEGLQLRSKQIASDAVVSRVDRIGEAMQTAKMPVVGLGGAFMARLPGSAAADVAALVTTIESRMASDTLNAQRAMSPTGAAFGNTSDADLQLLKTAIANLKTAQSPEQFKKELQAVKKHYIELIHGPGSADNLPPIGGPAKKSYGPVYEVK